VIQGCGASDVPASARVVKHLSQGGALRVRSVRRARKTPPP